MEEEFSRVVSEEKGDKGPAFMNNKHLDRLFRFGKLAGINFLTLLFVFGLGILFVFSGYKLFFQHRFFMLIYHFILNGNFHISEVPQAVWLWLIVFVLSWASLLAFFDRRVH